jgi:hypothetical protein
VSAASTGPLASDMVRRARASIPLPTMGYSLSAVSRDAPPWWSRPMDSNVCSMFARMPRYGPAPPGIRSASRMQVTGQNGSSRYGLALFDNSSRRINEQSSGLLIRSFGGQESGGAQRDSRRQESRSQAVSPLEAPHGHETRPGQQSAGCVCRTSGAAPFPSRAEGTCQGPSQVHLRYMPGIFAR